MKGGADSWFLLFPHLPVVPWSSFLCSQQPLLKCVFLQAVWGNHLFPRGTLTRLDTHAGWLLMEIQRGRAPFLRLHSLGLSHGAGGEG